MLPKRTRTLTKKNFKTCFVCATKKIPRIFVFLRQFYRIILAVEVSIFFFFDQTSYFAIVYIVVRQNASSKKKS